MAIITKLKTPWVQFWFNKEKANKDMIQLAKQGQAYELSQILNKNTIKSQDEIAEPNYCGSECGYSALHWGALLDNCDVVNSVMYA